MSALNKEGIMLQPQSAQQLSSLTPEANQVAATYQLGLPTAEYKFKLSIRYAILLVFLLVFLLGFIALGFATNQVLGFTIIGLLGFAALIVVMADMFRAIGTHVYVCPGGLLYLRQRKIEAIRWDQVDAVWQRITQRYSVGIKTVKTHLYTVRRNDGTTFKFNDQLSNVETLGDTIVGETTRLQYPRYVAAYQAGQTVNFGRISLSQQGVSNGKELLPWQQIQELTGKGGFISFQQKGNTPVKWTPVMAHNIPNVSVFVALIDYILKTGPK
jgi:hypothetical protein